MTYNFARYLNIRSAINPVLSPDGKRVAFLSDITGNFQVWSTEIAAGQRRWPRQLTFFPDKVWELHGTLAADHLVATSDVGGNERQQFYLISNYGNQGGHDVRRLTTNDDAIHRFGAWHKDGQQIVYTSNARNGVDFDLYRMDVASGHRECIYETSGNRTVLAWSPDGGSVLMLDAVATEQNELYLVDLASSAERHLTADQAWGRYNGLKWTESGVYVLSDREHDAFALCRLDMETAALDEIVNATELLKATGMREGELDGLTIAPDGVHAAVNLNVGGYSQLSIVNMRTGKRQTARAIPAGVIGSAKFSQDSSTLVFSLQTPQQNPDIWQMARTGSNLRQLTFSDLVGIDEQMFVHPETIHFPTFDGRDIPAFIYLPAQPAPAGGYPCILYVHGGPAGQQRPDFDVRFQYFLAQGYALLVTNVRGSTGYGRQYMMLDDLELRMDSVTDLKHAVLWLHQHPQINGARVAIYGRSYGGFMVLAALTEYPELFAAGIDVVGISDWVTFMERTSPWRRDHRGREYGSLENHRDLLARISPIHKAECITAPLLVLAGDNDPRVPLSESEQIVERVQAAGGTVKFIHYADEGHKFSKLPNRIDSFTQMAEFLSIHIGSPLQRA